MNGPSGWRRVVALFWALLSACATTPPPEHQETPTSWEQAQRDPTCVIPTCDDTRCVLWRCQSLVERDTASVVLARGTVGLRLPPVAHPGRWWGRPLFAPPDADPVFEIPWHNWTTRGRFAQRDRPLSCISPPEPLEKHHIFPQQPELASWFKRNQIDIHAYTIPLPRSFHAWLHSGGGRGGQWNEAWRQFQRENNVTTREAIWQFAFTLMSRFGVNGQLVPYYCK